jgi:hypothetical protein
VSTETDAGLSTGPGDATLCSLGYVAPETAFSEIVKPHELRVEHACSEKSAILNVNRTFFTVKGFVKSDNRSKAANVKILLSITRCLARVVASSRRPSN